MKLAAIDIGSNAARLLISDVTFTPQRKPLFNKLNLVRVPLRLGFDVFETGGISEEKQLMIVRTMLAYKALLDVYEVKHYKACATSAMRDSRNSLQVIDRVKNETGVAIEVISGDTEAAIIYENHVGENLDTHFAYLYVDVGGGSTELTLFSDNRLVFKQSFNIGTIRLLKKQVDDSVWVSMKDFLRKNTRRYRNLVVIGTGGNINKIFSMSKKKDGKPLSVDLLKDYFKDFNSISLGERMRYYDLREDRADVIVPALEIYLNVLRWADCKEIYVPKIGLADGLVKLLYQELALREIEV